MASLPLLRSSMRSSVCVFCSASSWRLQTARTAVTATIRPQPVRAFTSSPVLERVSKGKSKKKTQRSAEDLNKKYQQKRAEAKDAKIRKLTKPGASSLPTITKENLLNRVMVALRKINPDEDIMDSEEAKSWPKHANYPEMRKFFNSYVQSLLTQFQDESSVDYKSRIPHPNMLERIYLEDGPGELERYLWESYLFYMGYSRTNPIELRFGKMEAAADFRFPQEWYPSARSMQRTWHLHIGPTNSGKTYHALKRLEEAKTGIYAGPLRLLAYEVYERMNAKGLRCDLITGDDVRISEDGEEAPKTSSTVEMVSTSRDVDVCVLDEIQMIGDEDRGWAWTEALLGVRAKEVHMCGEERTANVIKALAASVGDKLVIHRYKRLGPLQVEKKSLEGDLRKIQPGDCVVTFSRRNIFALKKSIEEKTGRRCAVIYGSLPPETRSLQARLFNEQGNEFDILVASDAVGMGLNLSVKRIIFETMEKFNGVDMIPVPVPSVKQIAGRAGRFKPAPLVTTGTVPKTPNEIATPATTSESNTPITGKPKPTIGYVTTLEASDLNALSAAMAVDPHDILTAGVLPQTSHIERFASQHPPDVSFSEILSNLEEYMQTSKLFHVCSLQENIRAAKLFDDIPGLSIEERMMFIMAPMGRDASTLAGVKNMAKAVANNLPGSIVAIPGIDLEALDTTPKDITGLRRLESLHKFIVCYLWLSYRFPATFAPRELAMELKTIAEDKIQDCLDRIRFSRHKLLPHRRKAQQAQKLKEAETEAQAELTNHEALAPGKLAAIENGPPEDEVEEIEVFENDNNKDVLIDVGEYLTKDQQKQQQQQMAEEKKMRATCYRCGAKGHIADECRENPCIVCGARDHNERHSDKCPRLKGQDYREYLREYMRRKRQEDWAVESEKEAKANRKIRMRRGARG
ncbi:hypothetical protein EX30DRAFT_395746 [Ascodesmis nigricans]|uniref:RNA helicase n=1 Tax=Ascodesmis nigricans TaxID=341454 RepID=A0A4S2MX82_9PEZI|nr:hypothetical protein EX30DRAFT_395746 [Ascodesmis nigricans]